jgi:hypothetical protein
MYKESTLKKINNLKLNQTMRLGRCTIKCVENKSIETSEHGCNECIASKNKKNCREIACMSHQNINHTNTRYIKI